MTEVDVRAQLERIAKSDDFSSSSSDLVDEWYAAGADLQTVEPILAFMERHPEVDYGTPGPLVHFVEKFYRRGYEAKLLASVDRRPTPQTTWMLNRLINGTKTEPARTELVEAMKGIVNHPLADDTTRREAVQFVDRANSLA